MIADLHHLRLTHHSQRPGKSPKRGELPCEIEGKLRSNIGPYSQELYW